MDILLQRSPHFQHSTYRNFLVTDTGHSSPFDRALHRCSTTSSPCSQHRSIMPEQDLIDVRVLVDDQPLQVYREPETTDEGTDRVICIEITAGQEFGVQVTWSVGFNLHWADALYCKMWLMTATCSAITTFPKWTSLIREGS